MDPDNERQAIEFLTRANLVTPIRYHVSDAFSAFDATEGEFDIVYCDIDKGDYAEAWRRARDRVRVGGMYICDNMLWSGKVTGEAEEPDIERHSGWTEAIDATNQAIFNDSHYRATIVPLRDGVVVALRVS